MDSKTPEILRSQVWRELIVADVNKVKSSSTLKFCRNHDRNCVRGGDCNIRFSIAIAPKPNCMDNLGVRIEAVIGMILRERRLYT
jgi:hypothetical protein